MDHPPVTITGADPTDTGPAGCVARFVRAGADGDSAAAMRELHPDFMEGVSGAGSHPPGVVTIAIGAADVVEAGVHVPVMLIAEEGGEQRFVFLVRPNGDGWGIDLNGSLAATFGGDPMQMIEDGLRAAVQPLGEAMQALGEGIGEALSAGFGGDGGSDGDNRDRGPSARRLALDEPLPATPFAAPERIEAEALELHDQRRAVRDPDSGEIERSRDLALKVRWDLPVEWMAHETLGVTVESALDDGLAELAPADAPDDLGRERYAEWERERRDFYSRIPLRAPADGFRALERCEGRVRLAVTGGELVELLIDGVGGRLGQPIALAACDATIELRRDDDGNLVLVAPPAWMERMDSIVPLDAEGTVLSESWSGWSDGETAQRSWGVAVPDDGALRIRFWTQGGTVELPFRVRGLPLALG